MTAAPTSRSRSSENAIRRSKESARLSVGIAVGDEIRRRRIEAALTRDGLTVLAAAMFGDLVEGAGSPKGDRPAVVIVAPDDSPTQLAASIRMIREKLPGPPVVAVSPSDPAGRPDESLAATAEGVVLEGELETALAPAVRAVAAGQLSYPRSARAHLARPVLSWREKQVLGMVVLGFSNLEIATRLYLAESTVKSHLQSAYRKLGVRSRQEATALILDSREGLGTGILSISEN